MCDLQRETPLFDKLLPIQISDGIHDVRQSSSLVVRIISGNQIITNNAGNTLNIVSSTGGNIGQTEKVIHLEITDEKDPYFLYYMDVSEQEFHILKREQSILVEFNVYPTKLIELLELCLIGNPSSVFLGDPTISMSNVAHGFLASLDSSTSTFIAKLDTTTGIFSVVEANKFKQLTHISLLLKPGDDNAIKMYLAARLALSLNTGRKQTLSIQDLKMRLQTEEQNNQEISSELFNLKTKATVDVQTIKSEHTHELSQAQLQAMETIETMRLRFDTQLENIRITLEQTQKTLQEKTNSYEQQLSDISFEKGQLEFKLRDVERSLHSTEADRDRLLKEWDAINQQRHGLDTERMSMQREIVKLEAKVDSLEHQLIARDESMAKSTALQKASEDARESIEQRLQMYIANAEVLQENMRSGSIEIDRGNQIITQQNSEIKSMREKIKTKSDVIRKQEALINELRLKVVDTEHMLNASIETNKTNQNKISSLQQQLNDTLERLTESNSVIAGNQEVITYLNEEINKWQLGVRISPMMEPLSQVESSQRGYSAQQHATITPISYGSSNSSKYNHTYSGGGGGSTGSKSTYVATGQHSIIPVSPDVITDTIPNYRHGSKSSLDYSTQQQQHQVKQPLNLIQGNKNKSTLPLSQNQNLDGIQDIYLKGIQNLGLDSTTLTENNMGLDWLKSLHEPSGASGAKLMGHSGNGNNNNLDLESLDYYAIPTSSSDASGKQLNAQSKSTKNSLISGGPSSSSSPPHKTSRLPVRSSSNNVNSAGKLLDSHTYDWQLPDFGLA